MVSPIFVDKKEYISAIRASKKIGYASDYIGQLCRAKKIPGVLIGRTWYVDFNALVNHKKTRKLGKRSKPIIQQVREVIEPRVEKISREFENFTKKNNEPTSTSNYLSNFAIRYEGGELAALPNLFKKRIDEEVVVEPEVLKFSQYKFVAPIVLSLFLLLGSWAIYSGEITIRPIQNQTLLASVTSWLEGVFDTNSNNYQIPTSSSNNGIVVTPETENREGTIAQIKRAFSDDVEVNFDEEKDTGVLTPVFREGDDFHDYTFVLVPVKDANSEDSNEI